MFRSRWPGSSNTSSTPSRGGEKGLVSTLEFLDAKGYPHVGTARSAAERDKPVIVERNGVKVAFLSFTYSLNDHSNPAGKDYLVNHIRLTPPTST